MKDNPELIDEYLYIGGRFHLILLPCGMGPLIRFLQCEHIKSGLVNGVQLLIRYGIYNSLLHACCLFSGFLYNYEYFHFNSFCHHYYQ